jgi:hypothetical protein
MTPFKPVLGLSRAQLRRICQHRPLFLNIQALTGVPWEAVAAVWYRESFSVTPPATPGGPFQFDPVPPDRTLRRLLKRFTSLGDGEIERYVARGVNDFEAAALFAACWLRLKVGPVLNAQASDALIQEAFYGYNGRAYGSAQKSPYVMNGYSQAHTGMVLKGTIPDGRGGRRTIRTVDRRPGAFTVYKQLKQWNCEETITP